jgi:ribosome-associated protein
MSEPDRIRINDNLHIPLHELQLHFVRSSGPGGQHVNRSATQVELTFDVARSPSLDDTQRQRLQAQLKSLIDKEGILHLASQSTRSQLRNREDVIARFQQLLFVALKPRKRRRPTRPSAAAKERRLEQKKRRGATKRLRRSSGSEE